MKAHGVRPHVDDPDPHAAMMMWPHVGQSARGPQCACAARLKRVRLRIAASLGGRRRSPSLGCWRSHLPVGAELPGVASCRASRFLKIASISAADEMRLDRDEHFDPVVEVALHQVGSYPGVRLLIARLEAEEAAVLEEPAEDRAHADRSLSPSTPGREHADGADDQVDLGACLRGAVELLDDRRVGEVVDLDPDAGVLACRRRRRRRRGCARRARLRRVNGAARIFRNSLRAAEAGDEVEQVGDVGADVRVGGEEADVLVEARGRRVVVAGADVRVAPQPVALAADDERRLRVDLQIGEAVDDVHARLLERTRPLDVALLVEAGLELDDADALLAVLRRRRSAPGAIAESRLVR